MKSAAQAVFMAMAAVATIKPVVVGYQKKILAAHQFTNEHERAMYEKHGHEFTPRVLLDPKEAYHMNDADFAIYLAECDAEMAKAGLKVERPGECPLLVLESLERKAKHHLIESLQPITNITLDQATNNMEAYDKMVELALKLMAPFVKNEMKLA